MARVNVHGVDITDGTIERVRVRMHNLPARTIDRETALEWMRDGHSLITTKNANAWQLVEVDTDGESGWFIRIDNASTAEDSVGELPTVTAAGV